MKKRMIIVMLLGVVILAAGVMPSLADAVGGPQANTFRLEARSYRTFTVSFVGGRKAEVALLGDGDTDLDLQVYDENGNLVASDEDDTDRCYVSWTPKWTGPFTIKVVNHGWVHNIFRIATN